MPTILLLSFSRYGCSILLQFQPPSNHCFILQSRLFLSLPFMHFTLNDHCLAPGLFLYDLFPISRPRLEAHRTLSLPLNLGCSFQLVLCQKVNTSTVSTSVLRYSYQISFLPLPCLLLLDCYGIIRW